MTAAPLTPEEEQVVREDREGGHDYDRLSAMNKCPVAIICPSTCRCTVKDRVYKSKLEEAVWRYYARRGAARPPLRLRPGKASNRSVARPRRTGRRAEKQP